MSDYDTLGDFIANPQKAKAAITTVMFATGKSYEEAKKEVWDYIMSQPSGQVGQ